MRGYRFSNFFYGTGAEAIKKILCQYATLRHLEPSLQMAVKGRGVMGTLVLTVKCH